MSTVIYLSNQHIQAVTGTAGVKNVSVDNIIDAQAPEGSIINGMIMDPDAFVDFLKEFWEQNKLPLKDVTLVVGSSKFSGRIVEMPVMSAAKTYQFLDREFVDLKNDENEIYGYVELEGKKSGKRRVYAESIEDDFIEAYISIFTQAGITLKSICSGQGSLIHMIGQTAAKWYKTFMILLAEENTITTVLWVNGSFFHISSARCFHEKGTVDYVVDVARAASKVKQFMQANQLDYVYEAIVITGVANEDLAYYEAAIREQGIMAEITQFHWGDQSKDIQYYLYPVSGLMANSKTQNYLYRYVRNKKKNSELSKYKGEIILICSVFLVMIILWIGAFAIRHHNQKKYDDLVAYNQSPEVMFNSAQYDLQIQKNAGIVEQKKAVTSIGDNLKTYPVCNDEIRDLILDCAKGIADVEFTSFNADDGTVLFAASSDTVDKINVFIKKMNQDSTFKHIDYTGYTYEETTGKWDIHVTCVLKEAAGRGNQQ